MRGRLVIELQEGIATMKYQRMMSVILASVMAAGVLTACGTTEDTAAADSAATTEAATTEAADATSEGATEGTTAAEDADDASAGKGDKTSATISNNADYSSRKIGISIYQLTDDFMSLYRTELASYLDSLGFATNNVEIMDAANDSATQVNQIQSFIDEDVDILIVNAVDPAQAGTITDMAVEADIPLIYINREPDDAEETRWQENHWDVTYVGCDAASSGTMQGEIIAALDDMGDVDGDGTVTYLVIEGDGMSVDTTERTSYSVQAMQATGIQTQCVATNRANWDRDDAYEVAAAELAEHGDDIEVVLCNNDAMALGALKAIQEADRTVGKDIYLVGCDALEEALEDIIAGTMTGTVYNDYVAQSHAAADAAVNYITGAGNEHYIGCDYLKVTSANAQDVLDSLK